MATDKAFKQQRQLRYPELESERQRQRQRKRPIVRHHPVMFAYGPKPPTRHNAPMT